MVQWLINAVKWLFTKPKGICEWCGVKIPDNVRECDDCWWYRQW